MKSPTDAPSEVTPKNRRIAFYIAHGVDNQKVARKFGIHEKSLSRLINTDAMKAEIARIEKEIEERSMVMLEDANQPIYLALKKLNRTLVKIALDDAASDRDRIAAVKLANTIARPSLARDDESRKKTHELKINVNTDSDKKVGSPNLKVVNGGANG